MIQIPQPMMVGRWW